MSKFQFSDEEIIQKLEEIPACEMATVGRYGQKKGDTKMQTGFKVLVTSDEHPQSHIHIEELVKSNNKLKVCVRMICANYFSHGGWPNKFTQAQAREFDEFLRSPYSNPFEREWQGVKYRITTYWEYAILQWKLENEGMIDDIPLEVDKDGYVIFPEQPDYKLLNAVRVNNNG